MTSVWTLAERRDGTRVSVVLDAGRLAIVAPDSVLGLEAGEAAQLAQVLRRVSEGDVDSLPPCACAICEEQRARGERP